MTTRPLSPIDALSRLAASLCWASRAASRTRADGSRWIVSHRVSHRLEGQRALPGFRSNHAKGMSVAGFFDGIVQGVCLSRAVLFEPVTVIGRSALAGGTILQPLSIVLVQPFVPENTVQSAQQGKAPSSMLSSGAPIGSCGSSVWSSPSDDDRGGGPAGGYGTRAAEKPFSEPRALSATLRL